MPFDAQTIDRIVAGVLTQIGGQRKDRARPDVASGITRREAGRSAAQSAASFDRTSDRTASTRRQLTEKVITASQLEGFSENATVLVGAKAIITPAARDVIRERHLTIRRLDATATPAVTAEGALGGSVASMTGTPLLRNRLIVVTSNDATEQLWSQLHRQWQRELLGCPDEAADLAIAELSRGGIDVAVILTEQAHRAACMANRSPGVKAAVVRDAGDVANIRRQMRVNTWCIDPSRMSWFELTRLLKATTSTH